MATTVLVTSATGRIGKELVPRLAKCGKFHVRATVNTMSKADRLKELGANEVIHFDYKDKATWAPALDGVKIVYSASLDPLLSEHLEFSKFLGEYKSQLSHVVRISCMGADTLTACYDKHKHVSRDGADIPLMLQHYWWAEESLHKEGLPLTVLRNNFYMNHLLKTDCDNITNEGYFSNPLGRVRNSFVSTTDIAEAAAVIITEGPERHSNKFYDLTGAEPQNMYEIAEDLGKALGKKVEYRPQDFQQFEADFGPTRAAFFEYLTNGFYTRVSPDFYNITGHRSMTYYEYLTTPGPSGETGLQELYQGNLWKKGVDAMKAAAEANK